MKLSKEDKELLLEWGHPEEDLRQIQRATNQTTYEVDGKKISREEAIAILGKEVYLSGISRSAFHFSCCRSGKEGKHVYFDSSRMFK